MNWSDIVALIVRYGIEQAYEVWRIAQSGEPTEEAWEALRKLALKDYDTYIAEANARLADATRQSPPPT